MFDSCIHRQWHLPCPCSRRQDLTYRQCYRCKALRPDTVRCGQITVPLGIDRRGWSVPMLVLSTHHPTIVPALFVSDSSFRSGAPYGSPRSRLEQGASRSDVRPRRWRPARWALSLFRVSCRPGRHIDWTPAGGGLPAEDPRCWMVPTLFALTKLLRLDGQYKVWHVVVRDVMRQTVMMGVLLITMF